MYRIYGRYGGVSEELDICEDRDEAYFYVKEYRLAFGAGWTIWVVEER